MMNKNKNLVIGLTVALFVVILGGAILYVSMKKPDTTVSNTDTSTTSTTTATSSTSSNSNEVVISNYTYVPAVITVKKGTTVKWTNNDNVSHTITGDSGGPASGLLGKGETYSYTFNTTGSFSYHCDPHPYIKGTVIVQE